MKITLMIVLGFTLAHFLLWQALEFHNYKLQESKNTYMLSWQYIYMFLWGSVCAFSPAIWIGGIVFGAKALFKKTIFDN